MEAKNLVMSYFDQEGIKYADVGENVLRVTYNCDNKPSISVLLFFDSDGETIQFVCNDIARFAGKESNALITCNELNKKYRWVKFYMDEDKDIICEGDAVVDEATIGSEAEEVMGKVIGIVDQAYPVLMKALWA